MGEKRCARCGDTKALEEFVANRRMLDGRSSWCRACSNAANQEWRARNPDYVAGYNEGRRKERSSAACLDCGALFVPYRRDAVRCKACSRERKRAHAQTPSARLRYRNNNHLRRARVRAGDVSRDDVGRVLGSRSRCPLCGCQMVERSGTLRSKELDHIVPLAVGGTHTLGNIRVICRACNLSRPKDGRDLAGVQTSLWALAPSA